MTYLLSSIDDAIDRKFLVTKSVAGQVEAGTLVHIMGGSQDGMGVSVDYRVASTYQDYTIKFTSLKDFSKWLYDARGVYEQSRGELEQPTESDDEFMALYEQHPEWDAYDDWFVEAEPEITQAVCEAFELKS